MSAPYLRIGDPRARDKEALEFSAEDQQHRSCVFTVPRELLEDLEGVESLDSAKKLLDAFNRHKQAFQDAAARHFAPGAKVMFTICHVVPGHP